MRLTTAVIYGLGILGVEILFCFLIFSNNHGPGDGMAIFVFVPFLFLLNIIFGLFFYFRVSRKLSFVLFINSILAPVIFNFVWTSWDKGYIDRNYSRNTFTIDQDAFEISLSKKTDDFSITDITDQQNGTTTMLYYGKYQIKGDTIELMSARNKMFVINNVLYDFPRDSSGIRLKSAE
jgi:hypothetical protein